MTTPRSFPKQVFAGGTPFRGPLFWPKFKPFIWWWWWRFWWSKATQLLESSRSRLDLWPRQRLNGKKTNTVENTQIQRQIHFACHIHPNTDFLPFCTVQHWALSGYSQTGPVVKLKQSSLRFFSKLSTSRSQFGPNFKFRSRQLLLSTRNDWECPSESLKGERCQSNCV